MPNQLQQFPNFVIFKIDNAKVKIDIFFQDEILWLNQKQLAELFENIFVEKELDAKDLFSMKTEKNLEKNILFSRFFSWRNVF